MLTNQIVGSNGTTSFTLLTCFNEIIYYYPDYCFRKENFLRIERHFCRKKIITSLLYWCVTNYILLKEKTSKKYCQGLIMTI